MLHDFLAAVLSRPRKVIRELGYHVDEFEMHDPLAAYYVVDKAMDHERNNTEERWKLRRRAFLMERVGEWTKGSCVVDRRWVLPVVGQLSTYLSTRVCRGTHEVKGAVRTRDGISHEGAKKPAKGTTAESHGLEIMVVTETPGLPTFEALFLSRVTV